MATPLGHGIIGLALAQFGGNARPRRAWVWLGFAVVAAGAPDLDFVPGVLAGDANLYHQQGSHSLPAAVVFGLVVAGLTWGRVSRPAVIGALAGIMYASHLVLDCLTTDGRAPYGIPLLWPFSDMYFISPFTPFQGVRHGVPGDPLHSVLGDIFSRHNLRVLLVEAVWTLPVLAVSVLLTDRARRSRREDQRGR